MDDDSLVNHPAIRRANAASSSKIQSYVHVNQVVKDASCCFRVYKASELSESLKSRIWSIFEYNMKSIYEASNVFPWDPSDKRKQIFHEYSRFLLIIPDAGAEDAMHNEENLLAYSIFRFERDEERSVIYVYELQISESARRLGLGRALVHNLESIGRGFKMSLIMLTHLKVNDAAKAFYDSVGFEIDGTSPDYGQDEKNDKTSELDPGYSILSRKIDTL